MASCSLQQPRSAAGPRPVTSRIPKIALSVRRGVGHTRCARACERIGAFVSTEKRLRKPQGGAIDVGMGILTIKLRLEIGRTGGWSRIQVSGLSKNASGTLTRRESAAPFTCRTPACKTLRTTYTLVFDVIKPHACDSRTSRVLDDSTLRVELATAFEISEAKRGFHAGDFTWTGAAGLIVRGRMSGLTNVGTHRAPIFDPCQVCDVKDVMEGRLCGTVDSPNNPPTRGCQIT